MTNNEEQNSAEREAEEILKQAFTDAVAEECPNGEDCAVHFRVDELVREDDAQYIRVITYVGDYCVVTDDNHELENPVLILKAALGLIKKEDLPPRHETAIYLVGDGTLAELSEGSLETRRNSIRYLQFHDVYGAAQDFHEVTVSGLTSGLIDVSKPVVHKEGE